MPVSRDTVRQELSDLAMQETLCSSVLVIASLSTFLAAVVYAYQLGVVNTPLHAIAEDLHLGAAAAGSALVTALLAGGICGSLVAGQTADEIGPKKALAAASSFLCLGCTWTFFSPGGLYGLLIGRFIVGIASGGISLFVFRYISEVAPPPIRGALGSLSQLSICTGILLSYIAGMPYETHPHAVWGSVNWWRIMLIAPLPLAIVQLLLLLKSPESPVWLRWKGRMREAGEVERLLGVPPDTGQSEDSLEAAPLQEGDMRVLPEEEGPQTWMETLSSQHLKRLLLLAIGIPVTQQLSGINTVIYYSSEVFAKAGLQSPIMGSVIVGFINISGTVVATVLTDRHGRRPLLLLSHTGMAISLLGITLSSWIPGFSGQASADIAFACILLFVVFFSLGAGPLPFIYMSEVLGASSSIKGRVSSLATSLNWLANLMVGLSFPFLAASLGKIGGAYLLYSTLNFACAAFAAAFMLETKQRTIEEIRAELLHQD